MFVAWFGTMCGFVSVALLRLSIVSHYVNMVCGFGLFVLLSCFFVFCELGYILY